MPPGSRETPGSFPAGNSAVASCRRSAAWAPLLPLLDAPWSFWPFSAPRFSAILLIGGVFAYSHRTLELNRRVFQRLILSTVPVGLSRSSFARFNQASDGYGLIRRQIAIGRCSSVTSPGPWNQLAKFPSSSLRKAPPPRRSRLPRLAPLVG